MKNIIIGQNKILIIRRVAGKERLTVIKCFTQKFRERRTCIKFTPASSPTSTSLKTFLLISLQFRKEKQYLSLFSLSFSHFLSFSTTLTSRDTPRPDFFPASQRDELHPSLVHNCISTKSAAPRGSRYYRQGFPRRPVIETRTTSPISLSPPLFSDPA